MREGVSQSTTSLGGQEWNGNFRTIVCQHWLSSSAACTSLLENDGNSTVFGKTAQILALLANIGSRKPQQPDPGEAGRLAS